MIADEAARRTLFKPRSLMSSWRRRNEPPAVVVTRSDPRYVDLNRGANQRWVGSPDHVVLAQNTHQVLDTVAGVVRDGRRIAVRSGGHCPEGFVFTDTTQVLLDLSLLTQVCYDPQHNAISVGAGAALGTVYSELYRRWGVTVPGGSCTTVAAGGHIAAGGHGPLSRQLGLSVDYLHGVEVVTVDWLGRTKQVVATRYHRQGHLRDLWWAHTGGGGGNFGVVTRYLLKGPRVAGRNPADFLPAPPAEVYLHAIGLNWADLTKPVLRRLVTNFGNWHELNAAPGLPSAGLSSMLTLNTMTLDDDGHSSGQIGLITQVDATRPNARELLDGYLAAVLSSVGVRPGPLTVRSGERPPMPEFFAPTRLPWLTATQHLGGSPPIKRSKYKSAYLRRPFGQDQIEAMWRWLTRPDYTNLDAALHLASYGCAVNDTGPEVTAVAQRDSVLTARFHCHWDNDHDDEANLRWIRGFYGDVFTATGGVPVPNDDTDGCLIGYPDIDLSSKDWNASGRPWHWLYYKANYERLREIKTHWDPRNVFRHAQSVEPE